jgi:hypothetical protein
MTASVDEIQFTEQADFYEGAVSDSTEFVRTFLLNVYPDMDLQPTRALYDLLVRPGAELNAYNQTNINHYRSASSLQEIVENPDAYTEEDVDRILGNFRIDRDAGAKASGNVTIILSDDLTVSVPEGAIFTGAGLTFYAKSTYISTSGSLTTIFDRPLTQLSDGTWAFTIAVEAENTGEQYDLKQGTDIAWGTPSTGYVSSYVESDFSGGTDEETNKELIQKLDEGLAAKAMAGRVNISALIRESYPTARDISIIGFGDSEMLRDSHNIFGIKTGGKSDIYTRTSSKLVEQTITKSCTLIDWDNKTFQASIDRNDYPGFYAIQAVYPADRTGITGTLEISSEVRGVDVTDLPYVAPAIANIIEGAYTRYQTAVVQFQSPETDVTDLNVGDTVDFKFEVLGVPFIDDIQDYVAGRAVHNPQGDFLVRAPVPMLISISMQIDYVTGDEAVDVDAVKNEVASAINAIDFSLGRVPSSRVIDSAHNALTGRAAVHEPIDMMGVIRLPSGESRLLRSTTQLEVPEVVEEGVSSRNVSFYTDATAIEVSVVTVDTKSV